MDDTILFHDCQVAASQRDKTSAPSLSIHGEAGMVSWRAENVRYLDGEEGGAELIMSTHLPKVQLNLWRKFRLLPGREFPSYSSIKNESPPSV